jgi:hypothetical protein
MVTNEKNIFFIPLSRILHPDTPYFIILFFLTADDFTQSAAA